MSYVIDYVLLVIKVTFSEIFVGSSYRNTTQFTYFTTTDLISITIIILDGFTFTIAS
jgi:hypothetical protein